MTNCKYCNDTGDTGTSYQLHDCNHCTAARERVDLETAVSEAGTMSEYDQRWFVYKLVKKELLEKAQAVERHAFESDCEGGHWMVPDSGGDYVEYAEVIKALKP